jgi:hypothetical protein
VKGKDREKRASSLRDPGWLTRVGVSRPGSELGIQGLPIGELMFDGDNEGEFACIERISYLQSINSLYEGKLCDGGCNEILMHL